MHFERTHQIDSSEPDDAGMYEYFYEYDIYRFIAGDVCLVARSYTDEPTEAHFLRIETNGTNCPVTASDLSHPLFLYAQATLLADGKTCLRWLSGQKGGYEAIPVGSPHGA